MIHANELQRRGIKTMFGDASNSEILLHVGLEDARALVITAPNETTVELIVTAAHAIAPQLPIIARAATADRLSHLYRRGARHVINPELEGGLEMLRHTLLALGHSTNRIQPYVDAVRTESYEGILPEEGGYPVLDQLLMATRGVEIAWELLNPGSPVLSLIHI